MPRAIPISTFTTGRGLGRRLKLSLFGHRRCPAHPIYTFRYDCHVTHCFPYTLYVSITSKDLIPCGRVHVLLFQATPPTRLALHDLGLTPPSLRTT
jgi:hypothetical protein